jgi:hypothetical protein
MKLILFTLFISFNLSAEPLPSFSDNIFRQKARWISADHPKILLKNYDDKFGKMSDRKFIINYSQKLWSDSYWPRNLGGIAYRWQSQLRPKSSQFLSLKRLKKMSSLEISKLSPAEKYDISQSNYDYPFSKKILRKNPINASSWTGLCHGWAEASITHPPPKEKTVVNSDKISVSFGYSDLGGILSHYYGTMRGRVKFLGKRCRSTDSNTVACSGINAGSFHIVITNFIEKQKSFIIDVSRGKEVWNHPVAGYEYKVIDERAPSKNASYLAIREVKVKMEMSYMLSSLESWRRKEIKPGIKNYIYWLELDENGQVVGGSWVTHERPDFAWYRRKPKLSSKFRYLFN